MIFDNQNIYLTETRNIESNGNNKWQTFEQFNVIFSRWNGCLRKGIRPKPRTIHPGSLVVDWNEWFTWCLRYKTFFSRVFFFVSVFGFCLFILFITTILFENTCNKYKLLSVLSLLVSKFTTFNYNNSSGNAHKASDGPCPSSVCQLVCSYFLFLLEELFYPEF